MNVKRSKGFIGFVSLFVLILLLVLSVITFFIYERHVLYKNRVNVIHTLLAIQWAQKQYRMENKRYGTLADVWGDMSKTRHRHYDLIMTNVSSTTYTITAIGLKKQARDSQGKTSCAKLTLDYTNGVIEKRPPACWFP